MQRNPLDRTGSCSVRTEYEGVVIQAVGESRDLRVSNLEKWLKEMGLYTPDLQIESMAQKIRGLQQELHIAQAANKELTKQLLAAKG